MTLQKIVLGSALVGCLVGGLQADELVSNNGRQIQPAGHSVSTAAPVNPFKKECAAITKAKFAVMYLRGDGNCTLGSDLFGPSKNLAAFSHPSTGVYCFTPSKAAGLTSEKLLAAYPTVDVEWGNSSGSDLLAYIERGASSCPEGSIQVRTYDLSGGSATSSDDVAFYLKVN